MDTPAQGRSTPYRDAAMAYWSVGWLGVLPAPYRAKQFAKGFEGWTGHRGQWPSFADIHAWVEGDEGRGNLALRMPPNIIGLDTDAYGGKRGALTLAAKLAEWGPLPDTWSSTSRGDTDPSRIRFFRVPEGLWWPGGITPDIEIIQTTHRYAMVWPSVHPEGRVYKWYRPDGIASTVPPGPDDLAELPEPWILGLTGGRMAEEARFADLTTQQFGTWLTEHHRAGLCRGMRRAQDKLLTALQNGSAHESLRFLMDIIRKAEQGHSGLLEAIAATSAAFFAEATNAARSGSTRSMAQAQSEWQRSLSGAVSRVLGAATAPDGYFPPDPCDQFIGIDALVAGNDRPSMPLHTAGTGALAPQPAPSVAASPTLSVVPSSDDRDATGSDPTDGNTASPGSTDDAPEPIERTSWWPRDLAEVLAGGSSQPPPDVLLRTDGKGLLYAGKINGLIGESESGKSWLALLAVKQMLDDGDNVLYFDFEDSAAGIVERLRAMGVSDETLIQQFTYADPDEGLSMFATRDWRELLEQRKYRGIVVDGVNAVMTLFGLKIDSTEDTTRFSQMFLKPMAKHGAAIITIDHVGKNKESRGKGGIGSQAKRAMMTGSLISVEMTSPLGHGLVGKMGLEVDKDRAGHVRGMSDKGKFAGTATMKSSFDGKEVELIIEPSGVQGARQRAAERPPFRPTVIMAAISKMLATTDGALSQKQIETGVTGRAEIIRLALERLVEEGFAKRESGPRNAILHRHVCLFRELDDLVPGDDEEPR